MNHVTYIHAETDTEVLVSKNTRSAIANGHYITLGFAESGEVNDVSIFLSRETAQQVVDKLSEALASMRQEAPVA